MAENDRTERMEKRFEAPVIVAALLVIPAMALGRAQPGSTPYYASFALNLLIWLVFAAELAAVLWVTPDRWRWIRQNPLEPVIVLLTPPIMPASLQVARVLRLLRLVRLLRLASIARRLGSGDSVKFAAIIAVMTALGGGAAFASAEGKKVSTWDGVWWAVSTMTTVGYGDVVPKTEEGKIIAMLVMLVGIGFVAILTAAVAQSFVASQAAATAAQVEQAIESDISDALGSALREVGELQRRLGSLEAMLRQAGRADATLPGRDR